MIWMSTVLIARSYCLATYNFTSTMMLHWEAAFKLKYPAVTGISGMHDILVSEKSDKVAISYQSNVSMWEDTESIKLSTYPYHYGS